MIAIGIRRGSHEVCQVEVQPPTLGEDEVLVASVRVGICGTDREIIEGGDPHVPDGADALILGHEAVGRVRAVGRGVRGLAEGDLVVPSVRRPLSGDHADRADLADPGTFVERGIEKASGYAQELWAERPEYLTKVPEHLEPVAVLAEPFSIVEKAINETEVVQRARLGAAGLMPKVTRALVIGPGPVGFAAAFACLARGYEVAIAGRDKPDSEKVAFAKSLGVDYVNTESSDFGRLAADGRRWDLMIEAAGVGSLVFEATKALAPRGAIALTGIAPDYKKTPADVNQFLTETVVDNRLVIGSVNATMRDFRDAIAHLEWAHEHFPEQIRGLINNRYPVRDYADAYADVLDRSRKPDAIKTVLEF